jgi:VanZ family protein
MRFVKLWLPVLIWAAVILSASNDAFSADQSRDWLETIFRREFPEAVNFVVRKAGHVFFYGVLGALAVRADRRMFVALGIVLLVASADEYSQSLTRGRSGTPWDVLLDAFSAMLVMLTLRRARR